MNASEVVRQWRHIDSVPWTDYGDDADDAPGLNTWEHYVSSAHYETRELIPRPSHSPAVVAEPYCWANDDFVNHPGQMCEMRVVGAPGGSYNTPLYRVAQPATQVPSEVMEAAERIQGVLSSLLHGQRIPIDRDDAGVIVKFIQGAGHGQG